MKGESERNDGIEVKHESVLRVEKNVAIVNHQHGN